MRAVSSTKWRLNSASSRAWQSFCSTPIPRRNLSTMGSCRIGRIAGWLAPTWRAIGFCVRCFPRDGQSIHRAFFDWVVVANLRTARDLPCAFANVICPTSPFARCVWKSLGEPHVLGDIRTTYPARKFVWSKECRALNDDVLTRRASLSYYSGMTAAVLGLAMVATVVVAVVLRASSLRVPEIVRGATAGGGIWALARIRGSSIH